jgi:hypothetical protein
VVKLFTIHSFLNDFLKGTCGTKNYDENCEVYKFAMKQLLSELSPKNDFSVIGYPDMTTLKDISELVSKGPVVVLNLNSDHWVCVVDVDLTQNIIMCICSDVSGSVIHSYKESSSEKGLKYNRIYTISEDFRVHQPSVFQVQLRA